MMKTFHPYQLVSPSPWPILTSLVLFSAACTLIFSLHSSSILSSYMLMTLLILSLSSYQWWRDIIRESSYQGHHTNQIIYLLKNSMIMFILSEVLFFVSFFWAFFHSSIAPNPEIGMHWPPIGVEPFNPMGIPLLNSIILLSSGASITWAHHSLLNNNIPSTITGMLFTIFLGVYFSILQGIEYADAPFSFADSIYGSTFFLATGFHGIHVLLGSTFLVINTIRVALSHNSSTHMVGMDLGAWYWHFVDLVWLFLFISIYWWGH